MTELYEQYSPRRPEFVTEGSSILVFLGSGLTFSSLLLVTTSLGPKIGLRFPRLFQSVVSILSAGGRIL